MTDTQAQQDDDFHFRRSALESMREEEANFQVHGLTHAWINPEPEWRPELIEWCLYGDDMQPPAPSRHTVRFSLIGGGQIKMIQDWHWWQVSPSDERRLSSLQWPYRNPRVTAVAALQIAAHTKGGLVRCNGWISPGASCEMSTKAVVSRTASQEIVDRVAATFRVLVQEPDNFYALLDGSEGCAFCRRPLSDEISKLVGVGPDCARQNNIPHSMAAASKRLEARRCLLGEQS